MSGAPIGALARHPQPIGDDDIGGAALNGDLGGVGVGELGDLELELGLLIEPERATTASSQTPEPVFCRARRRRSAARGKAERSEEGNSQDISEH